LFPQSVLRGSLQQRMWAKNFGEPIRSVEERPHRLKMVSVVLLDCAALFDLYPWPCGPCHCSVRVLFICIRALPTAGLQQLFGRRACGRPHGRGEKSPPAFCSPMVPLAFRQPTQCPPPAPPRSWLSLRACPGPAVVSILLCRPTLLLLLGLGLPRVAVLGPLR
jgi:hypothetical protein